MRIDASSTPSRALETKPRAAAGSWGPIEMLVVGLCFLLNMLDGTDMLIMSFVAPLLSADWSVSAESLGVLFSASLAGMAIGCLGIAPLADRIGRRSMIVMALAIVAAAMASSALVDGVHELMLARLFVGIGVGAIGVSMTALAAEYAPAAYADFAVGFVQAGWPLGSIITALVAAKLLPRESWQSMFLGIGSLSAVLFFVVLGWLPESLTFLNLQRPPDALVKINAIRSRMRLDALAELPLELERKNVISAAKLLASRTTPSLLLWTSVTLSYFVLYFVISWIPKLAVRAGLPFAEAIYAGATYNLGAFVGTTALGFIAIHYRLNRAIAVFLGLAAIALIAFGGAAMPVGLTLLVAFLIGVTVQGGFNGYWALAARLYPPEMRSTGTGWALGVGRIGAVMGPIVGGLLVGANVALLNIFAIFASVSLLAAGITLRIKIDRKE